MSPKYVFQTNDKAIGPRCGLVLAGYWVVLDGIGQHWRPLAANANLWKRVWPVILDGIGLHFRVVLGWYWVVLGGIGAHLARVVSNIDNQTQWATRMCRGQVGQKGIGGGPTSWYIKLRACRSAALPLPCVQNVRFASVEFYAPTSEALLEFYPGLTESKSKLINNIATCLLCSFQRYSGCLRS